MARDTGTRRDPEAAGVVDLRAHPAFNAAERRASAMEEAMRRHPSFQSRTA
ncbi:hypothetical protein [Mycolicibacterium sp. 018/SC-01/001]|uniref:hypothetical protein n=1 Tax=Mycolicibacterium sp. 018/SC-01/001 TaxID=2592069 RepID=UPI00163DAFED|nr:hypothetical protein [Mycolicibacterium sp. 018/SC-01/001]